MARTVDNRKGPKTGTKPKKSTSKSGAQKRKERKEKLARERASVEQRARELGVLPAAQPPSSAVTPPSEAGPPELQWAEEFSGLKPDLTCPETDLLYVRKVQLTVLRQQTTTPNPTKEQVAYWDRIMRMCATVGMTHPRSVLEAKVRELTNKLAAAQSQSGATKIEDASTITRPTTARGGRGRRGPRPLPGLGPGPTQGKDP